MNASQHIHKIYELTTQKQSRRHSDKKITIGINLSQGTPEIQRKNAG